jgi:hypothetical protein
VPACHLPRERTDRCQRRRRSHGPRAARPQRLRLRLALVAALTCGTLAAPLAAPLAGQPVLDFREELAFDRPEAWAMAWFAAVTLPGALGPPPALTPGQVELAFEGGSVPTLSAEQRTVGFLGTKPEDLNRTPVVGRPRVAVGLPGGLLLEAGWMPPLEVDGVKPDLRSLAVSRELLGGERGRLAMRLMAEEGGFRGDLTCPADVAAAGADPDRNPFGCEGPSRDEMRVRTVGAEVTAAWRPAAAPRLTPYLTLGWARLDAELQVDARYNGLIDRTLLVTDGELRTAALGLSWEARRRWRVSGELFYAPLDVVRREGASREDDGLLNARALLAYRLR